MKKVSKGSLQWSVRASASQLWRERRAKGVLRQRKFRRGHQRTHSTVKLRLPEIVSLSGSERRANLVATIKRLKDSCQDGNISIVTIDFSKVKELHPCGTLLFLAELERLFESPEIAKKLAATYPSNNVVEQMLQHIRLLERLGLPPRLENIVADSVVSWLHASGTEGELDSIADILPKVLTEGSNMELRIALLSGMAEAVANSSEHAYQKSVGRCDQRKKWWLFARQVGDEIAVAICDLGLGIPGTLESNWRDEVAAVLKTRSGLKRLDHRMIELAFTVGKTRTERKNRGKGLKDILKVVREQKVGSIFIYSNKGIYVMDNADATNLSYDEKVSIHGTIIMWKIPIEAFGFNEAGSI